MVGSEEQTEERKVICVLGVLLNFVEIGQHVVTLATKTAAFLLLSCLFSLVRNLSGEL